MDKHKRTYELFTMITTDIAIAAGKAIVQKFNPVLFDEKNGPALELTPN